MSTGDFPQGRLLGASDVRRLADALGVAPTKRLGQNFVHDANTVRRIVRLAAVAPGDRVLEVGPGLGSLTLGLLEAGAEVVAVEIDERLAAALPGTARELLGDAADRLTVVPGDAITVAVPGEPVRVVANLPYNVAVPVLLRLLADVPSLAAGVVMVQAEVGERLAAPPGSKTYGVPSVKGAWYGRFELAGTVPRGVFWPVPNVDSVLVRFTRQPPRGDETLRRAVFRVVDAAFAQRRKTLRQALAGVAGGTDAAAALLTAAGVEPGERGERLGIDAFVALAERLPA
ncbi:16S rRNA (adenine(1518)-N(6)/adenine(1519)-N(6))-dimethyltransferase RsmA [Amnibacterium sp. CER49]|uniref:16S rRNA (adenine(1518)-N(6)/adenine(1519)-N(6))- dimethyltransferase RsmA n=1 Tax=Amnibacterium sp. CER49 TaxID=3039161 RepID=UPI002447DCE7|nr:16S rRNA (adenine(1518)-N(6)/adenine(1519)-N(6))-dimethyltransferase RsmA [Amnibacterium sp. CER49]MDH2445493.1 16S rRNA (adenine(1518)-N(6)/adenine(1519)-N(6))-dimethyltransferase RsmA [Amnibacterium sp. CER49]